ncbi:MAG: hypothetical protein PHV51_01890 [Methanosarcinaceae archaeon]|nr:hypothetical protein [Methanosarcinaceae archaeon]
MGAGFFSDFLKKRAGSFSDFLKKRAGFLGFFEKEVAEKHENE